MFCLFELKKFSKKIEKLFVGAGGGVTHPKNPFVAYILFCGNIDVFGNINRTIILLII